MEKKFPIIRVSVHPDTKGYELAMQIYENLVTRNLFTGWNGMSDFKVTVSYKHKKRRKLKTVKFSYMSWHSYCDCGCNDRQITYEYA